MQYSATEDPWQIIGGKAQASSSLPRELWERDTKLVLEFELKTFQTSSPWPLPDHTLA